MTRARPTPSPRICAHCHKPYDGLFGWDWSIVTASGAEVTSGSPGTGIDSCSAACRRELGVVERYPVKP